MGNIVEGLQITIIGMGVVFIALFILSLILELFKILFYKEEIVEREETLTKATEEKVDKVTEEKELDHLVPVISAVMAEVLTENEYVLNIKQIT